MSWFRVDDMSAFHKKVMKAGNAAWGAFCRMGAHSAHYELDGFVPAEIATVIASNDEIERLLSVGFLDRADGGYVIHDFLEWNPSAKDLAKLRKARANAGQMGGKRSAGKRQAIAQARHGASAQAIASANAEQNPSSGIGIGNGSLGSDLGGDAGGAVDQAPDAVVAPRGTGPLDPGFVRHQATFWVEAYTRAVRRVLCTPWSFPTPQAGALQAVIEAHCLGEQRRDIDAWIERDVAGFVGAVRASGDSPSFWSSFGPTGWQRWHNATTAGDQSPSHPRLRSAKARGDVQPLPAGPRPAWMNPRAVNADDEPGDPT